MAQSWLIELSDNVKRLRPAHAWFLEIDLVCKVCVSVCLPPRLVITSGMMWCDVDPIWLGKILINDLQFAKVPEFCTIQCCK